jgi:hypothetical protein
VISDITDQKKELDKPVYEANKPIYGSDSDDYVDEDDYDEEEDYDYVDEEDDYIDDGDDSEGSFEELAEQDELDVVMTYNVYIDNRLSSGQKVTLKHLADIKVSRDRNLTCSEIKDLIDNDSDYNVLVDEDKPLYLYEIG